LADITSKVKQIDNYIAIHGDSMTSEDAFRDMVTSSISNDSFMIVNFLIPKYLGEVVNGHISPLSAYSTE
jgi:hypothetical protein